MESHRRIVPVMSFGDPNATRQMQAVSDAPARVATDQEMEAFLSAFRHECSYLVDRFSVVVFGRTSMRTDGRLFRFVSKRYLPSVCNTVRLTSPMSYGHDEQSPGVDVRFGSPLWLREKRRGDGREGIFTLTGDFVDRLCPGLNTQIDTKGLLHVGFNSGWMLCTALVSDLKTMNVVRSQFPGKAVVKIRDDHTGFATRLGIAFGRYQHHEITKGTRLYRMVFDEGVLKATVGAIAVFHGPVKYMEESRRNAYLTDLAESQGPLVALETQFTKTKSFEEEHEYRFLVCGWGVPNRPHVTLCMDDVLCASLGDDGSFAPMPKPINHLTGVEPFGWSEQEFLHAIPWRVAQSSTVCAGRSGDKLFPLNTLSWIGGGTPMVGQPNELVRQIVNQLRVDVTG